MASAAPSPEQELARLANLGPKSAAMLVAAGVQSLAQLQKLGAVKAYALAKRRGSVAVSINDNPSHA